MAQTNAKAQFFDELAQGWEERNYPPEVRARLVPLVASFPLKDGDTVLDVGCGEGVLVPYLRERVGVTGRLIELAPWGSQKGSSTTLVIESRGGIDSPTFGIY